MARKKCRLIDSKAGLVTSCEWWAKPINPELDVCRGAKPHAGMQGLWGTGVPRNARVAWRDRDPLQMEGAAPELRLVAVMAGDMTAAIRYDMI